MVGKMRGALVVSFLSLAACGSSSSSSAQPSPDAGSTPDAGTTSSVTIKFATLDGAQETPAKTTNGFGAGVLAVDGTTGKVAGFVVTSGLVATTAAHVHDAARGTPGGIIVPLTGGPDIWVVPDGAAALTAAQMADFAAGNLYFNVHTNANPGGEIRGQLDKTGTARFAALDGSQETPATGSTAFGGGVLAVDASTGKVAGFITTAGLVGATAAHVHDAARGTPGGIIVPLTGGPDLWVVPDGAAAITAAQVTDFAAGDLYYNAHTPAHPGGEIRGQLERTGDIRFASLDGSQETPPTGSAAFGAGALAVDDGSGKVGGFIVTSGLVSATAAHVHDAARGTPGSIIVPLTGGPNVWVVPDGATPITAAQVADFGAGNLYYNAHTAAHTGGEIRGQLDRP